LASASEPFQTVSWKSFTVSAPFNGRFGVRDCFCAMIDSLTFCGHHDHIAFCGSG
jgi:hypothetical protein